MRKRTADTLAVAAAHGLEVTDENIIVEYSSGADTAGRPGMTDLLARVEDGQVGTVVMTRFDRLARDSGEKRLLVDCRGSLCSGFRRRGHTDLRIEWRQDSTFRGGCGHLTVSNNIG